MTAPLEVISTIYLKILIFGLMVAIQRETEFSSEAVRAQRIRFATPVSANQLSRFGRGWTWWGWWWGRCHSGLFG
jgi:hypothetical protein